jgi:hypothetical protein
MHQITRQSPRQRGYGSTSSLRNDSLKHTRKHERREGGIEPRSKAHRLWRTVRPGGADRPHWPRGPSGLPPRTVRTNTADYLALRRGPSDKSHRTTSGATRTTDRPLGARGQSARHPRTVRNFVQPKLKTTTDRNEMRARTRRTPDEHVQRGPSAGTTRTVREARTEQKKRPTSKVNSPNSSSDFPNGRSCEDKGLGT